MTKGRDRAVKGYRVMGTLRHDAPGAATSLGRVTFSDKECETIIIFVLLRVYQVRKRLPDKRVPRLSLRPSNQS